MRAGLGHSLPASDKRFIRDVQRLVRGAFARASKGRVGGQLDREFEDFSIPQIARRLEQRPTPSNVVLGMDEVTIRLSELKKYAQILDRARELSPEIQGLRSRVDRANRTILTFLKSTKTVYRGTTISYLENMVRAGGKIGLQRRIMYAAKMDSVSTSVDASVALLFAQGKKTRGVIMEMDMSRMTASSYMPVTYESRRSVYVTPGGKHEYNPYERFGGTQSILYMGEYEVQIKKGAKPPIRGITVPGERQTRFKNRLARAVRALEKIHGQEIKIKYVGGQS